MTQVQVSSTMEEPECPRGTGLGLPATWLPPAPAQHSHGGVEPGGPKCHMLSQMPGISVHGMY